MAPARRLLALLLTTAALLAPTASAQVGVQVSAHVLSGAAPAGEGEPGELLELLVDIVTPERVNTSWRAYLNGTIDGAPFETAFQLSATGGAFNLSRPFNVPSAASGEVAIAIEVTVQSLTQTASEPPASEGNATGNTSDNATAPPQASARWVTEEIHAETLSLPIAGPPTPPPGPPFTLYATIGALLVVALGAVLVVRRKPRQVKAAPRSQALQEMAQEDAAAKGKRSTQEVAVTTQEPRMHPQLKILEARAADVRRLIELAKERKERGDITEHQFRTIRDKKEAELQAIHEEMEQYRDSSA